MKKQLKVVLTTVLLSGFASVAVSQINILPNGNIEIRDYNHASGYWTYNYGDLSVQGGNGGSTWGWIWSNQARINGYTSIGGDLEVSSNAYIYGSLNVTGSKNFLQPHPTDITKFIRYSAAESGEALTIARGTAKTVKGEATIALPEHFSLVTNKDEPISVILTPEAAPVLLYTKQKSTKELVVAMKPADLRKYKDVEFSYQVTGVRDGFENQEVIVSEDKLNSPSLARADVQKRINTHIEKKKARQNLELENKKKEVSVSVPAEAKE